MKKHQFMPIYPHTNLRHFIVIGNPINHSKSPQIHQAFAKQIGLTIRYEHQYCPIDFDSFEAVVTAFFNGGGVGANVTLPFKEWAYQLCQHNVSPLALSAQAVNTLSIKHGKLFGDNTDGIGLVADLTHKGIDLKDKNIAILGAGGAVRGVLLPLLHAGAKLSIFNRTFAKAQKLIDDFNHHLSVFDNVDYNNLSDNLHLFTLNTHQLNAHEFTQLGTKNFTDFDVIINATSSTTHHQSLALPPTLNAKIAYDMAYGKPSAFLDYFKRNTLCFDGMGMLLQQAKYSFALWNGVDSDLLILPSTTAV